MIYSVSPISSCSTPLFPRYVSLSLSLSNVPAWRLKRLPIIDRSTDHHRASSPSPPRKWTFSCFGRSGGGCNGPNKLVKISIERSHHRRGRGSIFTAAVVSELFLFIFFFLSLSLFLFSTARGAISAIFSNEHHLVTRQTPRLVVAFLSKGVGTPS